MILDFKEIPQANLSTGEQDTFELFARDFLQTLGYKILQHPDRGADGKKDLIVQEARVGLSGVTHIKWLVSCKHYAHSGKSVSDTDEPNILDRISVHNCDGFLGFYSTLPATSLGKNLEGLKSKAEIQTFDREQIEKIILDTPDGLKLANRYFSTSYGNYVTENPKPAKIFSDELSINCEYCGRNLLEDKKGIFVLLRRIENIDSDEEYKREPYAKAYFSCNGHCDRVLKNKYFQKEIFIDEWIDISDYLSPTGYIKKVMAWLNSFQQDNELIETEAFEKLKKLFLNTFPYIAREQTTEENKRMRHYLEQGLVDFL
jgi:hypothetical protein